MIKSSGIKDMASSVDWGKIMSRSDARNALIGTALGALVVGGASMMRDKDPEESKYAPVGDALTGAALGGLAGYGIPKGIELFADSGSLAPDDDRLEYNFPRAATVGAIGGTSAAGASILRTLSNESRRLTESVNKLEPGSSRTAHYNQARAELDAARRRGEPPAKIDSLKRKLLMHDVTDEGSRRAERILDGLRRRAKRVGGTAGDALLREYSDLKALRMSSTRGYSSFFDLIKRVGERGDAVRSSNPKGIFHGFIHPIQWLKDINSPRHFHTGKLLRLGPRIGPGLRMALRGGKWGLIGAGLGMLAHWGLGPSSRDNFKKG